MSGNKSVPISRRQFLSRCLQVSAGCVIAQSALAKGLSQYMHNLNERHLSFFHLRTGEKLKTVYWANGHYLDDSLSEINHLLRDFRQNEVKAIDPRVLDQIFSIQTMLESRGTIQIISGYRTDKTNNMLVQQKRGAVKNSFHTLT